MSKPQAPETAKRRWRRLDCAGKCSTTGTAYLGADVHQSFTMPGKFYVELRGVGAHWPRYLGGFLGSEAAAKRAVSRWLASRAPRTGRR